MSEWEIESQDENSIVLKKVSAVSTGGGRGFNFHLADSTIN